MSKYRDYGNIQGQTAPLVEIDSTRRSLVYQATHKGEDRLPFMNRSFISFSYGGQWIEDFDLLAVIDGDFMQRNLYAEFSDNITESEVWDGQLFWDSHFNANTLPLVLFTDGINEKQLSRFKHWFSPGNIRELVLAEHPNRAIMARIGEVPSFEMLPFEEPATVMVAGQEYETSTTLYKGKISISFVMDDPLWYSRANVLDAVLTSTGKYTGQWVDANNKEVIATSDKDALKIVYEDNVPLSSMIKLESDVSALKILFGINGLLSEDLSLAADGSRVDIDGDDPDEGGARVDSGHVAYIYSVKEEGISLLEASEIISDNNWIVRDSVNVYYAGDAYVYPTLHFTIIPTINLSNGYISLPNNSFTLESKPYNIIVLEGKEKRYFKFTIPGIYTGYNQAIKVFRTFGATGESVAWEEVRIALRDNVKHWAPREFAILLVNQKSLDVGEFETESIATPTALGDCISEMVNFLIDINDSNSYYSASFDINGETGEAKGIFKFNMPAEEDELELEYEMHESVENVGNMIKSDYLIINETNHPDENGYISAWSDEHKEYCHRLYSDCPLSDVNLEYKYRYL